MQLDIAVESVLTANGAAARGGVAAAAPGRRDGRPQHRRALGGDGRGRPGVEQRRATRRRSAMACTLLRRGRRPPGAPARRAAGARRPTTRRPWSSPRGGRRAAPGDGQLPAPGRARRRARRGRAGARRSRRPTGSSSRCCRTTARFTRRCSRRSPRTCAPSSPAFRCGRRARGATRARPPRATPTTPRRSASCWSSTGRARCASARRSRRSRGRRAHVRRGRPARQHDVVHRGHPARPAVCAVAADVRRRPAVTQLNHLVGRCWRSTTSTRRGAPVRRPRRRREVDWRAAAGRPRGPRPRVASRSRRLADAQARSDVNGACRPPVRTPKAGRSPPRRPTAAATRRDGNGHGNGNGAAPSAVRRPGAAGAARPAHAQAARGRYRRPRSSSTCDHGPVPAAGARRHAGRTWAPAPGGAAFPLLGHDRGAPSRGSSWSPAASSTPPQDRYLLDHTLGRDVSRTDPELSALAVMPLAMSIEMLAEAAAALVTERRVTGLRDVRAHRWLAWAEAPRTLEVTARRLARRRRRPRPRARGAARPRRRTATARAVEATVLLADAYRPGAGAAGPPLHDGASLRAGRPGQLYGDAMFHGPSWQGVRERRGRRRRPPRARGSRCCRPRGCCADDRPRASCWTRSCSTPPARSSASGRPSSSTAAGSSSRSGSTALDLHGPRRAGRRGADVHRRDRAASATRSCARTSRSSAPTGAAGCG